jgi:peptidylprolyl isomerase
MRLTRILAALTGLLCAGALAAQTPQSLPTSGQPVPAAAVNAVPAPAPALDPENTLHLDLSTGGRVSIQLRPDVAPSHVARMKTLVRQGFYNGVIFHRVIEGFMAQGGDPTGTGAGGSPLPDLKAEFNALPHVRGALSAARSEGVDSANSQFFIMFAPRLTLDGKYTVFGRVVAGMAYVDAINRGEPPAAPSRIVRASIGSDNVPPLSPAELLAAGQQQAAAQQKAAAAAAQASAGQSIEAGAAAGMAAQAAERGDAQAAGDQARAAAVAAEGAAAAAKDAAEVADQAEDRANPK